MARVLLIKAAKYSRYNPNATYPLGLMYIASMLELKRKDNVKIIDLRCEEADIPKIINNFKPDIVGISALTVEAYSMHRLAEEIKNHSHKIVVVCGGPHPSSSPHKVLSDPHIDIVVRGEGEETVLDLLKVYDGSNHPEDVRGIGYRKNGKMVFTDLRHPIPDIDLLPFPAWHLVDIDIYSKIISQATVGKRRYMNLLTTRGCPYRCFYCHNIFGKEFRARSPANVMAEISTLRDKYGLKHFEIIDDIFNFDAKRAIDILSRIEEEKFGITLSFSNGLRGDRLDRGLLKKMKSAGTDYVAMALESASPRIQRLMKKNLNLNKLENAISDASHLGIFTCLFTMIGFPTETKEEIQQTIEFACKSRAHTISVHVVTPFEGTRLGTEYRNLIRSIDDENYDYVEGKYNLSLVSNKDLFRMQWLGYLKFYSSPRRLFRIIFTHPNPKSLFFYLLLVIKKIIIILKKIPMSS